MGLLMRLPLVCTALLLGLAWPTSASAGLHYSGESWAELPARWRGFLLDQRLLRNVAVRPSASNPASPTRVRYQKEAARLARLAGAGKLSADQSADLGALYLRLGEVNKALAVLRPAQRAHPVHFRLAANLGTAWQLYGDLFQASACLQQAVRLAPGKHRKAEKLHLELLRQRIRAKKDTQKLDALFRVRYVGPGGKYEPGRLASAQRKALPANAVALAQQLALWLPADGRLLWQLAELAGAHGDVTTAAAMLDGCVTEFGLRAPDLQAHRKAMRAAATARARKVGSSKEEHEKHALVFKPRSSHPLVRKSGAPPPISARGVNSLAWEVLADTTVDRRSRPTFSRYLKELAGKQVRLTGFMQPIGDDPDLSSFLLIEHPVGCWYCEMPEMVNIVLIEMPADKTVRPTRGQVRVTGKLTLNDSDPENFYYTVGDAKVTVTE
jgi:hypothetical protein